MRHPVNSGDINKGNLSHIAGECSDAEVIKAKEALKQKGMGYVVEAIDNHYQGKTFVTQFDDSTQFTKAYTEDLLDCLNVAFDQSKRVLNDIDLADTIKLET